MPLIQSAKAFVKDVLDRIQARPPGREENQIAEKFFEDRKKEVLNSIRDHIVSRELRAHTKPSSLLPSGVKSSFYGFVGLPSGSKPVDVILDITNKKMKYTVKKKLLRRGMTVEILFPDIRDYRVPELTLAWLGGYGLVDGVEKGISGLSYFISTNEKNKNRSRSREGLQAVNRVRTAEYTGRPYLSAIFAKAQEQAKQFKF